MTLFNLYTNRDLKKKKRERKKTMLNVTNPSLNTNAMWIILLFCHRQHDGFSSVDFSLMVPIQLQQHQVS